MQESIQDISFLISDYLESFNVETLKGNQHIKGLSGSAKAIATAQYFKRHKQNALVVLNDKEQAAYFAGDLRAVLNDDQVLFFPFSYKRSLKESQTDASSLVLRTDVLNLLHQSKQSYIVVTYPEALIEKVSSKQQLVDQVIEMGVGQTLDLGFVDELLHELKFERVDFVYQPGQYAVRGSLLDVFSFSDEHPYRIDFFGDEIESIRTFDIDNQLSLKSLEQIRVLPNLQYNDEHEQVSFTAFLGKESLLICEDFSYTMQRISELTEQFENTSTSIHLVEKQSLLKELNAFNLISFKKVDTKSLETLNYNTEPQPAFQKNFDLLINDLRLKKEDHYKGFIISENAQQIDRLHHIFEDQKVSISLYQVNKNLHEGFVDHEQRFFIYTDHQIFDRYHKHQIKTQFAKEGAFTLKEINELQAGDYVVHQDHGIGKFVGLQTIDVNGKPQESIRLLYKDNDTLFISIHSLHRISKYKGKDGTPPKMYKLGSGAWQKTKAKTKSKVKDIAKELIALYAKRLQQEGFAYSPDTYLQEELEASFIYEDTPDQYKATQAVKEDMERNIPMDRLICGDVGFGKTEIAIRAAFKAATEGKQTAILVPTTILAFQHYNTFSERLKNLPVKIQYISRMRSAKQQSEIKKQLKSGEIDIVIGTHKLIGKDMIFKDLGLLIVDEEQKFGVAMKEKLKHLKINVDTLTLTATPIPRTLQFSLMGARDLSVINTPPPNRYPIQTELHTFSEAIIKEAIEYEINRGGQVFFIHNRVQNIHEVEKMIQRSCPGVSTVVAHGQMDGPKLEQIMLDFIDGKYGVLIATTIIESGLDIPNANTIIVNNANNFGLSTLHQLRGRVGRTNKKAFAYFLAPPPTSLTDEARRRLKAIEDFSELGSGFNIALQDLDIRGAGDVLGGEQSGFIAEIGFETYQKILHEAIHELKEQEFKDTFAEDLKIDPDKIDQMQFVNDCQIDTDLELRLPEYYVQNISERMKLYRDLDNIQNPEDLSQFKLMLEDRFGPLPEVSLELLEVINLRAFAIRLGIERISIKSDKMKCYFISDSDSLYYQSTHFGKVLQWLQNNPNKAELKDVKGKLILTIPCINSIYKANAVLNSIE
ncbi:MAG: transcription-repair coupling factor [Bacteroidales bacterium]|nr:transcription-repair coupling factor [Bacteroidales bacterium]